MKKRIRLQGMLVFLSLLAVIASAGFLFPRWKSRIAEDFFDVFGLLAVLAGFFVRIVSRGYKEDASHNGTILVTEGPYRLMRNPMYFGTLLIGTGVVSLLLRWWTFPVFLVVYLLIYIPQIRKEEAFLTGKFGQAYVRFLSSRMKYLPDIRQWGGISKTLAAFKTSWIRKELVSLFLTLGVIFLIEARQDICMFGMRAFVDEGIEFAVLILAFVLVTWIVVRAHKTV